MDSIASRTQEAFPMPALWLGSLEDVYTATLAEIDSRNVDASIWARDGRLWKQDPAQVRDIQHRLGWLDMPAVMPIEIARLEALRDEIVASGYKHIVLLGMGGSSLAPEVIARVLGNAPGYPDLRVLDTTDSAQILTQTSQLPLAETLFITASKSGTTAEMLSLYQYFQARCQNDLGDEWPEHFVAITDPGTPLIELAEKAGFRAIYQNPPDIGGRFSALSLFGLLPAALIGADLEKLLEGARQMAVQCGALHNSKTNPGSTLGTLLGAATRVGRDKLTLLTSPALRSVGAWVEQLIAESTGKEGKGILPVVDEPLLEVSLYGSDRLFVYLRLDDDNAALDAQAQALIDAGQPLVALTLRNRLDLGSQFFVWEYATAVAGVIMELNPFDQPNVESAKNSARQALQAYEQTQTLPVLTPVLVDETLTIYGPHLAAQSLEAYLAEFFAQSQPGDYGAIMAYVERNDENADLLAQQATALTERYGIPVTIGFGPRFLHSTGQLHKGDGNHGLFVQLTQLNQPDLEIPGLGYSFGVLKEAQAIGDWQALESVGRRVMRIGMTGDLTADLLKIAKKIKIL